MLDDITDTVASTFLGLTVGCARCHDHKFDPIPQKDYYRLQAFFAGTTNNDRSSLLTGEQAAQYQNQYAEWEGKTREIRSEMQSLLDTVRPNVTKDGIGMFPERGSGRRFHCA